MGLAFIKEVGKKITEETGEKRSTSFLLQSLGIAVKRGNSLSIIGAMKQDESVLDGTFLL